MNRSNRIIRTCQKCNHPKIKKKIIHNQHNCDKKIAQYQLFWENKENLIALKILEQNEKEKHKKLLVSLQH